MRWLVRLSLHRQMKSAIAAVPGVGDNALLVFDRARYYTIGDLYAFDLDKLPGDPRLMMAIEYIKTTAGKRALPPQYYHSIYKRCAAIVNKIRNGDKALPFPPDHLLCKLSFCVMRDPVIAPSGYSYERAEIEDWIALHGTDPLTAEPLTAEQLYPNNPLREAISYYRNNK